MSDLSQSVLAFDDLLANTLNNYLSLSAKIGGHVKTHSDMVSVAVRYQRDFLVTASKSIKPDDSTLINLLKPTSVQISQIQDFREKNRTNEHFVHLSAISESIPALGWVTVSPTPGPYVKEMVDASQFYTNKVLVSYKEKDKTHTEWAKAWLSFLTGLQAYIKQYHTTGLTWNPRGVKATAVQSNGSSAGGPLLPPPPPPPAGFFDESSKDDDRSALFAQLNVGTDVTRGLRKVSAEQQTHKNPTLRTTSVVPDKPTIAAKPANLGAQRQQARMPPKFELEGKKWMIENQIGQKNLIIENAEMNQSINVYKCEDCVLQVKGKVNSITVDLSKKFSIVFDNIVSVVEFINSQKIQAQAMGVVPTVTVDKVDNFELYLGKDSLKCEIISSKSSGINISVPNSSGDYVEHPIPEQLKTVWTGKGFKTDAVESA
ncbi:adenylyl cyclase-associated protein 1-like [Oppia nitens]|uniref:adenylyl cyclase-associated protein 1-like n=1 Tax=Oppia nitens TaxID=1686743 RepID=UPI0023DC421A|nr:adenylyl cyclase-associated protein 1-like [Oppia nitens]